jgi:hypothetical protein
MTVPKGNPVSSTPARYTSSPTTVEAMQYHAANVADVGRWAGSKFQYFPKLKLARIYVDANEAWLTIEDGEWVIKDALGFYPCKDEVFRKKYHRTIDREDELRADGHTLHIPAGTFPPDAELLVEDSHEVIVLVDNQPDWDLTEKLKKMTKGFRTVVWDAV